MTNAPRRHLTEVLNEITEQIGDLKKKRKATQRRSQRLTAEIHTLEAEQSDVRRALDDLGGPLEDDGDGT